MKRTSLICLALAATLTCTGLTACGSDTTSTDTTTVATTETPIATPDPNEHLHLDSAVFPTEFDFNDTESIERLFDVCEIVDGAQISVEKHAKNIRIRAKTGGETFTLNINLSGAEGHTSPEQIVTVAKLFWYCYPQMYARFAVKNTPTNVTIKFENFGYEIASTGGDEIHIHDQWLEKNPVDFDCLTHELAHVIQSGWDGNYCPADGDDTYMIERFADYCRFLYAYKSGYYNDSTWTLQTSTSENTYAKSVRFWVWLDYTYSTADVDIMQRIQKAVTSKTYGREAWAATGEAWTVMFEGTNAAGKDLNALWDEFTASDIANLSSNAREQGGRSALLAKAPLRTAVRDRYPESDDYLKVQ